MSSVVERDKRDSALVVQSLLEPSNVFTFRVGEIVDLGGTVRSTVGSWQVGHYRLDTNCIYNYRSAPAIRGGLTHIGFTSVEEKSDTVVDHLG